MADDTEGESSESIVMNLMKALKLEDEMKMISQVDLAGYNMRYARGLGVHLPNLKSANL